MSFLKKNYFICCFYTIIKTLVRVNTEPTLHSRSSEWLRYESTKWLLCSFLIVQSQNCYHSSSNTFCQAQWLQAMGWRNKSTKTVLLPRLTQPQTTLCQSESPPGAHVNHRINIKRAEKGMQTSIWVLLSSSLYDYMFRQKCEKKNIFYCGLAFSTISTKIN
jgi:hypothetical protein